MLHPTWASYQGQIVLLRLGRYDSGRVPTILFPNVGETKLRVNYEGQTTLEVFSPFIILNGDHTLEREELHFQGIASMRLGYVCP